MRKSNKIPRGKPVDKATLCPAERLRMDFDEVIGIASIQQFAAGINIINTCTAIIHYLFPYKIKKSTT